LVCEVTRAPLFGIGRQKNFTTCAYETIPDKPIIAGQTTGPDVIMVQPETLGGLALGRK
jgi:hypothetical protein